MSTLVDVRAERVPAARRFLRPSAGGIFSVGMVVVVGILVGVPTLAVLVMSLRTGLPGQARPMTLANFQEVFSDPFTGQVMGNTLAFAALAIFVTIIFAVPLVWLVTRTDLPGKETI